jgi:hypothetical protein
MIPNTGEVMTLDEMIERAKRSVVALQSPLDLIVSESVSHACLRRGCSDAIDMVTLVEGSTTIEQASCNEVAGVPMYQDQVNLQPMQEVSQLNEKHVSPSPSLQTCSDDSESVDSYAEMIQSRKVFVPRKYSCY